MSQSRSTTEIGNEFDSSSFVDVLEMFRKKIGSGIHCLDIGIVSEVGSESCRVTLLNTDDISCNFIFLKDLHLTRGDLVLIGFTDTDFRKNLVAYKNDKPLVNAKETEYHKFVNGIIIGIIYHKEEA